MSTQPLTTNGAWRTRMINAGRRIRAAYNTALRLNNTKSRLVGLTKAAEALESGNRAYGIAKPWPVLAARCRAIAKELEKGLAEIAARNAADAVVAQAWAADAQENTQPAGNAPAAA